MANKTVKSKSKPTKIEEMTKEQIRQAIIKKRECTARAQSIVESLLETSVTENFLLECLPEINQTHFEDVIEERSIIHLCGYPLCCKALSEKDIPKQKYKISMKTNKVYDITARKRFCSNSCYKSAMHVKKQMLTSPLWFREYENMPIFQLLPLDSVGSLGEEVDLAIVKKVQEKKQLFTCINDFAKASLNDFSESDDQANVTGEGKKEDTDSSENNVAHNKTYNDQKTTDCLTKNSTSYIDTTLQMHNQNEGHKLEELSMEEIVERSTKSNENHSQNEGHKLEELSKQKTVERSAKCNENNTNDIDTTLHTHNQNKGNKLEELSKEETVEGSSKCTQLKPKPQQGTNKGVISKIIPNPFNIVGDIIEKNVDPIITNIDNKQKTIQKRVTPRK